MATPTATRRLLLPRALTHSNLFLKPNARRLLKARHQEFEQLTIHTTIHRAPSEPNTQPITTYVFHMANRAPRGEHDSSWTFRRRYSEFFCFRRQLLALIQYWEASVSPMESATTEFTAISNSLRRPLTHDFPRRHLRMDTAKIIDERCAGLEAFVRKLLVTYADIGVFVDELHGTASIQHIRRIHKVYTEIEQFLEIPASQKELERYRTLAIRSLTDVEVDIAHDPTKHDGEADSNEGYACCICMNEDCDLMGFQRLPGEGKLVRLPCSHHFHEDCVLDWFGASLTCPLCRQAVIDHTA